MSLGIATEVVRLDDPSNDTLNYDQIPITLIVTEEPFKAMHCNNRQVATCSIQQLLYNVLDPAEKHAYPYAQLISNLFKHVSQGPVVSIMFDKAYPRRQRKEWIALCRKLLMAMGIDKPVVKSKKL